LHKYTALLTSSSPQFLTILQGSVWGSIVVKDTFLHDVSAQITEVSVYFNGEVALESLIVVGLFDIEDNPKPLSLQVNRQ
jgi:hypothetical protein